MLLLFKKYLKGNFLQPLYFYFIFHILYNIFLKYINTIFNMKYKHYIFIIIYI